MNTPKKEIRPSSKRSLVIIILVVITVAGAAVYINKNSRRELREMAAGQYRIQQLMRTRLVASAIENHLNQFISDLHFMATTDPVLTSASPSHELFYSPRKRLQKATSIRFLSAKGLLTFIYPCEGFRRKLIGKSYDTEDYYKAALSTGKMAISTFLYNEENEPRLRIAIPVFENARSSPRIKGILVGSFDPIAVLNKIIAPIVSQESTEYAWILNSDGYFLTHPVKELRGKNSFGARKKKDPAFSYEKIEKIQQKMIQGGEGTDTYSSGWHKDQKGYIEKFVAYSPIKIVDSNWSVAICSPKNTLDAIIEKTDRYQDYTLFFILFVFSTGGMLFFRNSYQRYRLYEQSLKFNEQKLNAVTQASPVGMCLVKKRKIYWANETLHTMFGYNHDDLAGKHARMFYPDDATYQRIGKALYADYSVSNPFQSTSRCIKKDGTYFYCSLRSCPLNPSDRSEGFIVVVGDITERVAVENENMRLKDHIIKAQRMEAIGILASGIAHDFNNILFPITGYAEMLLMDTAKGSDAHEYVMNILNASNRAKELIDQILSFSRQKESESTSVRVQPIVKETLKLLKKTIPTTINIVQRIDKNCKPVMADATQIHQVVMNLCTNAYQAMEKSGGTISVELCETDIHKNDSTRFLELQPGRYVQLSIADTGIGMDEKTALKIFEPYFTTKETGKGTGLGLAVAHGIVKKAGGDIKVVSEPDKGTCFYLYLPVIDSTAEKTYIVRDENDCIKGTGHILLVDDEEPIVKMEQKFLQRLGYDTTACTNSVRALEIFETNPDAFDLVITDLTMPELTGDKLAREMKKINPGIPVIICTGFKKNDKKAWTDAVNDCEFLVKPVTMKALSISISNALKRPEERPSQTV